MGGPGADLKAELNEARAQLARLAEEARLAAEQQRATGEILRILSQSRFDPRSVFRTIVESALRLCDADSATIALYRGGRSQVAANAGWFSDENAYNAALGDIPLVPDRGTITGRIHMAKGPVHIPDLDADRELRRPTVPYTGARSVLAVPLLGEGEVVGILIVRRRQLRPFAEGDIRLLTTFSSEAVIAIENTRLFATVKRQADEISRFMSPQVASLITSDDGAKLLEGHRRAITVLFCDLRGFTAFSETAEPEEVLGVLREYHAAMGELIVRSGGTLEHFAGDGIMVFFNDPVPMEDHERAAVAMALAMQERFADLARGWTSRGHDLGLGVGIATGYATLGRIGFEGRYDYGAVGNVVILASRLSSEARKGQILVSQRVQAAIERNVETEPLGELALKGLTRPTPAFRVVAAR